MLCASFHGESAFQKGFSGSSNASPMAPHAHGRDPGVWQVVATSQPETLPLTEMLSVAPELMVTLSPIGRQRRRALGWVPREREMAMPGRCSKGKHKA